jgi:nucleoside-specific outer membrane channel protein Tsx
MNIGTLRRGLVSTLLLACVQAFAPDARAQDAPSFNISSVTARYGWTFTEPDIAEHVPKNIFTFENTAAGRWWSSYLFVDVLRSWSEADANAKEVYGEWYPTLSLRGIAGKPRWTGVVRDIGITAGLNTGVRSTGPSPFALLPGVTFDLKVPGFAFLSVGTFAYIDRGRFQGQPTDCTATTYQITPSWSVPIPAGRTSLKLTGFADFIGRHANCESQMLTTPRLLLDLSDLWGTPGRVFIGADWVYWHNKYGIAGLEDNLILPVFVWVL